MNGLEIRLAQLLSVRHPICQQHILPRQHIRCRKLVHRTFSKIRRYPFRIDHRLLIEGVRLNPFLHIGHVEIDEAGQRHIQGSCSSQLELVFPGKGIPLRFEPTFREPLALPVPGQIAELHNPRSVFLLICRHISAPPDRRRCASRSNSY